MDTKTTIEFEALARRLLDGPVRETVFKIQETLIVSLIDRLIRERDAATDAKRDGVMVSMDILLAYLEALRDSFSK